MTSDVTFVVSSIVLFFFFFNDTATTEIYTLSLHDALPISLLQLLVRGGLLVIIGLRRLPRGDVLLRLLQLLRAVRSEEHTSELQSRQYLVCRLLLEKKKQI